MTLTVTSETSYTASVRINGVEIQPENGEYAFVMPAAPVTVTAVFSLNPWNTLQGWINAGGQYTLEQDYIADPGDGPLVVPSGKAVTLIMQGHTIDRGLTQAQENGNVITVESGATLTITNGGVITGGDHTGNGGGIYNAGTLNLYDGVITGNEAKGEKDNGHNGQGGEILNKGTMNVARNPDVSDNTALQGYNIWVNKVMGDWLFCQPPKTLFTQFFIIILALSGSVLFYH